MLHPGHRGREQARHAQVAALRQRLAAAGSPARRRASAPGCDSEPRRAPPPADAAKQPVKSEAAERAASPNLPPPAEAAEPADASTADVDMGGEGDAPAQGGGSLVGQVAPGARAPVEAEGRQANAAELPAAGPRGDALLLRQDAEVAEVSLPVSPFEVDLVLLVGVLAFHAAANLAQMGWPHLRTSALCRGWESTREAMANAQPVKHEPG